MTIQQSLRAYAEDGNLYLRDNLRTALLEAAAHIDWLETEAVAGLREALQPFGKINIWSSSPDDKIWFAPFAADAITIGDIRRVKRALSRAPSPPTTTSPVLNG